MLKTSNVLKLYATEPLVLELFDENQGNIFSRSISPLTETFLIKLQRKGMGHFHNIFQDEDIKEGTKCTKVLRKKKIPLFS